MSACKHKQAMPMVPGVTYEAFAIASSGGCVWCERDGLLQQNDDLRKRLAEVEKDAARYRWLRKGEPNKLPAASATQQDGSGPFTSMILPGVHSRQVVVYEDVLDEQIDSAIQEASHG